MSPYRKASIRPIGFSLEPGSLCGQAYTSMTRDGQSLLRVSFASGVFSYESRLFLRDQFRSETPESDLWLGCCTFGEKFFGFFDKGIDDVLAGDFAHRHAVFKDHAHAAAKRDPQLRIVRFTGTVHRATHDRK